MIVHSYVKFPEGIFWVAMILTEGLEESATLALFMRDSSISYMFSHENIVLVQMVISMTTSLPGLLLVFHKWARVLLKAILTMMGNEAIHFAHV